MEHRIVLSSTKRASFAQNNQVRGHTEREREREIESKETPFPLFVPFEGDDKPGAVELIGTINHAQHHACCARRAEHHQPYLLTLTLPLPSPPCIYTATSKQNTTTTRTGNKEALFKANINFNTITMRGSLKVEEFASGVHLFLGFVFCSAFVTYSLG